MPLPVPASADEPVIGVVVLSQGTRPDELRRCIEGVLVQRGVRVDLVCVGNGWRPDGLPAEVRTVALAENVGIPAARNLGASHVAGDLVLFLDDDAWLDDLDLLRCVTRLFADRPRLGAVQTRIASEDGVTLRRWVPRAHVGDPARPGPAFNLAEGVTVVRRAAFDEIGGWAAQFFYGHEGIDFTWRLWGAGWEVHYAGDLVARHPLTEVTRHADFHRLNARNRVWSARRNLPYPLLAVYLTAWSVVTTARLVAQPSALRTWWAGFAEGWRTSAGPRRPMSWRAVWRLTRLGQPPVL